MKQLAYKTIILAAAAALFVGCAPIQVRKEAKHVKVTQASPKDMRSCQYIGVVKGCSSDEKIPKAMKGAKNDMRNKAQTMGGNYVAWQKKTLTPLQVALQVPTPIRHISIVYGFITYAHHVSLEGRVYQCGSDDTV